MDLGAYINIGNLEDVVNTKGIHVPRLRGYRLMKEEDPLTEDQIKECSSFEYSAYNLIEEYFIREAIDQLIKSDLAEYSRTKNKKFYTRGVRLYTSTGKCKKKYFDYYGKREFHWERFHGKLRKELKFLYKNELKRAKEQFSVWNKYAGQENILYIHARIGGNNWEYYGGPELTKEPWFLEKVDDCFDNTYCDIYAKLD